MTASPVANVESASSTTTSPASTPILTRRPICSTAGTICERRAKGALRVVLVRERDAERGHDGVAGELLDGAAVRHDAARDVVEVVVDALPDDLRIGARDESRGVDEIDEQDGRQLPFHASSLGSGEEATAVP